MIYPTQYIMSSKTKLDMLDRNLGLVIIQYGIFSPSYITYKICILHLRFSFLKK